MLQPLRDCRGYLLAFLALAYISNLHVGLYEQTKLEAKEDRMEAQIIQHEAEIKEMEKVERQSSASRRLNGLRLEWRNGIVTPTSGTISGYPIRYSARAS